MRRLLREENGSILPLIIFYMALSLVLVLVVAAASSLYLDRKRLFTLADGAALVGAEAFDLEDVDATPGGPRLELSSPEVAAAVADYLAQAPTGSLESLTVERAETVDGRSATVSLSAFWRPPVLTLFVPDGIRIEVTTVARSVFS
jgi:hypothetical protein